MIERSKEKKEKPVNLIPLISFDEGSENWSDFPGSFQKLHAKFTILADATRSTPPKTLRFFIPKMQEDMYLEERETKHVKLNEDEMDTQHKIEMTQN